MLSIWRRCSRGDQGFTLVESVAALLVATIIFLALAASAMAGVRASLTSRQNQQATDFMTRALEEARLLSFAALGHSAADLAGDPRITSCTAGAYCVDPGTGSPEAVHLLPTGAGVDPHITSPDTTVESNGTDFEVSTYVTEAVGQDPDLVRRVTVFVTWDAYGTTRTRSTSSLVAHAQRGLPLPSFKLTPVGDDTVTINPGSTAVFGAELTNQGATDRWNISVTGIATWSLLVDDGDGAYEPSQDTTALTDTNGDAIVDTDTVVPAGAVTFWIVRTTGGSEASGSSTITVTAKSVGQPSATTASQSLTFTLKIVTGAVTPTPGPSATTAPPGPLDCSVPAPAAYNAPGGYTGIERTLHNTATPGDSTAQTNMVMNDAGAYASTLHRYSTDVDPSATGRVLRPSSSPDLSETDIARYAQWRHQVVLTSNGKNGQFDGSARIRLWAAAPTTSEVRLKVIVYTLAPGGTGTVVKEQIRSFTNWSCSGFQELYLETGDIPDTSVQDKGYIGVRVLNLGTTDIRLAYDVAGAYPAAFTLGQK